MENFKRSGMFSAITVLGANILVAISKFVGYAISGSAAMLNESIHSIVDCSNQILLLFGNRQVNKGQSGLHQFDESRAKYFFSTIAAMMLFFGGGTLEVMKAFEKLTHPSHEVDNPIVVVAVSLFGLVIKGSSLHVTIKEIKELNTEDLSTMRFLHESRYNEILIIFTENLCAVIGLILALARTILTHATGIAAFDAINGLMIDFLLMGAAIFLAKEFYSLITDESVTANDLSKIKLAFERPEISRPIDIKTVHLNPAEILVATEAGIVGNKENETYPIINDIEKNIRQSLPDKKMYIYIGTDKYDPSYSHK